MLAWIIAIAAALFLANLCVHVHFARRTQRLFEQAPPFRVPQSDLDVPRERFEYSTPGGAKVSGTLFWPHGEQPHGVVVFCPEASATSLSALNYLPAALHAGFAIVGIDFGIETPVNGDDALRPRHWCMSEQVEETRAALEFVHGHDRLRSLPVAVFGISRGATAAVVAGADSSRVKAAIAQGAFSVRALQGYHGRRWVEREFGRYAVLIPQWHIRTTMWISRLFSQRCWNCRYAHLEPFLNAWANRPVLFISAGNDSYVPPDIARDACLATGHDPALAHWIVHKAKHNRERATAPDQYDAKLVEFLRSSLLNSHETNATQQQGSDAAPAA